jgi:UDPglucose 6-dehydrogenase
LYDVVVDNETEVEMKIGLIGLGKVGSAVSYGFRRIGHEVFAHDLRLDTTIEDVLHTPITFICVPTPMTKEHCCDINIVHSVIEELIDLGYRGLIVIKSTVTPGFTDTMILKYGINQARFAFCPEFLRERAAYSDFVEGNDVCIVGAYELSDYDLIKKAHGSLPKSFALITPIEAELAKYFSNVFNALRIVFACQFFDVCKLVGADYTAIKAAIVKRHNIDDFYLDANDQLRAFGGSCLPKDTMAFARYVESLGLDLPLFQMIVDINEEMRK